MGCCCSCFKKKNKRQVDDLEPLVTNDNNEELGQGIENYDVLEEFANNLMIVESYEITPREYERRSKIYEMKLNQTNFEIPQQPCLLNDIPNPEMVLASAAIDCDDEKMIQDFLKDAVEALKDFKIEHKEEVIASFPP